MSSQTKAAWVLSIPTVGSSCAWAAIYMNPKIGFNPALGLPLIVLFLAGWICSVIGTIYTSYAFFTHRSSSITACFAINLIGLALNILGTIASFGAYAQMM